VLGRGRWGERNCTHTHTHTHTLLGPRPLCSLLPHSRKKMSMQGHLPECTPHRPTHRQVRPREGRPRGPRGRIETHGYKAGLRNGLRVTAHQGHAHCQHHRSYCCPHCRRSAVLGMAQGTTMATGGQLCASEPLNLPAALIDVRPGTGLTGRGCQHCARVRVSGGNRHHHDWGRKAGISPFSSVHCQCAAGSCQQCQVSANIVLSPMGRGEER
jgi:hypothetical protein